MKTSSKSSRSQPAKNQHGMTLRSAKNESLIDLCEIIRQRDKRITSLEGQKKRFQAALAAKDNEIEKVLAKLEEVFRLAALYGLEHIFGTAEESFEVPEEQIPQGSGEQTVEKSRPEIDGFEDVSLFNNGMVRRRDMYGPEVEGSLGMVRHGTTSPAADNSRQVVAMELEIMSQTGLRFHRYRRRFRESASALEEAANSFGIYVDPDTENRSPAGPSGSGRMPLGKRRRDNTISRNLKQVRINDTSATPKSKQTPKSSTIPFSPLADISEAYNSTAPAPLPLNVSYSSSSQTVRLWNINMDQGAGTLAEMHGVDVQEPATFEMYEDPDAENEEQGSRVGPSSSGLMPLGESQREGTITWNPNMDQDADTADRSFEVPEEQNPQDSGEHGNGDVVMPVATDAGRILFDMPTAKTSRGKKRSIEEDEDDNQSRKKFRD